MGMPPTTNHNTFYDSDILTYKYTSPRTMPPNKIFSASIGLPIKFIYTHMTNADAAKDLTKTGRFYVGAEMSDRMGRTTPLAAFSILDIHALRKCPSSLRKLDFFFFFLILIRLLAS